MCGTRTRVSGNPSLWRLMSRLRSIRTPDRTNRSYSVWIVAWLDYRPGDRDVVTRYHGQHGGDKIRVRLGLADGAGGMNALRIRVCRIRKELRICVVECTKRLLN